MFAALQSACAGKAVCHLLAEELPVQASGIYSLERACLERSCVVGYGVVPRRERYVHYGRGVCVSGCAMSVIVCGVRIAAPTLAFELSQCKIVPIQKKNRFCNLYVQFFALLCLEIDTRGVRDVTAWVAIYSASLGYIPHIRGPGLPVAPLRTCSHQCSYTRL